MIRRRGIAATSGSALAVTLGLLTTSLASGQSFSPEQMPGALQDVSIEQNLDAELPLDAAFLDEDGNAVTLGDFFNERPVVLTFVYYECPMLCPMILSAMAASLDVVPFSVGEEFDVVVVSVDPGEGPAEAQAAKKLAIDRYGRPETADGWHFLTGDESSIARVAETAGYSYVYIPEDDEYAHASGIMIVTPQGRIAQYYLGIDFPPRDVRLALVEASSNKIGSVVDQALLYCYRFNPQLGKYTPVAMRILRVTGAVFLAGLALFLWTLRRREQAQSPA